MNGSRSRKEKTAGNATSPGAEREAGSALAGNQSEWQELLKGADEMRSDSGWVKGARLTFAGPAVGQGVYAAEVQFNLRNSI